MKERRKDMDNSPKTLWIKRQFLEEILAGRKTVEVRVGYRNILELKPGMTLMLNDEHEMKIKDVRRYPTFSAMAEAEEADRIVPGMSKGELVQVLKSLYPPFKEKLGVLAIELELPQKQSK